MLKLFAILPRSLQERALPLDKIGIADGYAWSVEDLSEILELLHTRHRDIIVLGGDVLKKNTENKSIDYAYANWHYDGDKPEESIAMARNYLERLHEIQKGHDHDLFVNPVVAKLRVS